MALNSNNQYNRQPGSPSSQRQRIEGPSPNQLSAAVGKQVAEKMAEDIQGVPPKEVATILQSLPPKPEFTPKRAEILSASYENIKNAPAEKEFPKNSPEYYAKELIRYVKAGKIDSIREFYQKHSFNNDLFSPDILGSALATMQQHLPKDLHMEHYPHFGMLWKYINEHIEATQSTQSPLSLQESLQLMLMWITTHSDKKSLKIDKMTSYPLDTQFLISLFHPYEQELELRDDDSRHAFADKFVIKNGKDVIGNLPPKGKELYDHREATYKAELEKWEQERDAKLAELSPKKKEVISTAIKNEENQTNSFYKNVLKLDKAEARHQRIIKKLNSAVFFDSKALKQTQVILMEKDPKKRRERFIKFIQSRLQPAPDGLSPENSHRIATRLIESYEQLVREIQAKLEKGDTFLHLMQEMSSRGSGWKPLQAGQENYREATKEKSTRPEDRIRQETISTYRGRPPSCSAHCRNTEKTKDYAGQSKGTGRTQ